MIRRLARGVAAPLALALSTFLGCASQSGDAFMSALAAGERAYHAGRYRDAARSFSDAASRAERRKDRDEARLMEARSFQRLGAWDEARAAYERLVRDSPTGPRAARAEFELARLAIEHGDAEAGWVMLRDATRRHPGHGDARRALLQLLEHEEERGGPTAALAWLNGEAPLLRGTELDQEVGYQTGRLLERSGDREGAIRALVAAARAHPYPFGPLTDDALFHAAELAAALGRPKEAIGYLRELVAPRERTVSGSYDRDKFDNAQFRIAELYRDALSDHAAARKEFRQLYRRYTTSILRDDALWAEAKLWLADGRTEEACATAALLARELPDSRYARCAQALCPALSAPQRPCADYIVRELNGARRD